MTGTMKACLMVAMTLLALMAQPAAAASNKMIYQNYQNLCSGQPVIERKHEKVLKALVGQVGTASLKLSTSPQHEAACWMLRENKGWNPQRFALAVVYFATKGINWDYNSGWMTASHECKWFGVKCNALKTVVELDLGYMKVDGLLPRELGMLTALKDLDMHGNDLQGVIPHKLFASINKLEYLRLHMNGMFGALHKEIAHMTKLREIHLFGNYMGGTIPRELASLKKLEVIDLYANMFEGRIPKELARLPKLKVLDLHDNNLTGTMPQEICDRKLDVLAADCYGHKPEVRCDCCTVCCQGLPAMICVDMKTGNKVDNVYGEVAPTTKSKKKKRK